MHIKAIIFDLDDTLFDQTSQITPKALHSVAHALAARALDSESALSKKLLEHNTPHFVHKLNSLLDSYTLDEDTRKEMFTTGWKAYTNSEFLQEISPYPDVESTLRALKPNYQLILITTGNANYQEEKVKGLGLASYFDLILCDESADKEEKILFVLKQFCLKPREVISVGDRIDSEIKAANKLGLITVRFLRGKYSILQPKHHYEHPDYEIKSLSELLALLERTDKTELYLQKGPNIVVIGGGTGMPFVLNGLKHYTSNLTAIVTVTDSGRSSGMLRKELGMLPPGDIRNNLIALSNTEEILIELFQYRFKEGQLEGHTVGNLFLAGLAKITGSFEEAIVQASRILNVRGRVMPSTLEDVNVCAVRSDGSKACCEDEIVQRFDIAKENPPKLKEIYLNPTHPKGYPPALKAIADAEFIIIGPGSLYTSIITNLLIPDIAEAIRSSKAKKIYICNIVTQPFQTDGFTVSEHLKTIHKVLGTHVDYCLVNVKSPDLDVLHLYEKEGSHLVKVDKEEIEQLGVIPVTADIIQEPTAEEKDMNAFWHKRDLLRHDPRKLAQQIIALTDSQYCEHRLKCYAEREQE